MPWLSDNAAGMMAFAGVSLMLVILLRKYFRYHGRVKRESRREQTGTRRPTHALEPPKDAMRWQVEFHETCRDLMAELDSKMRALQIMTAEAQAAAERLEQALDKTRDSTD